MNEEQNAQLDNWLLNKAPQFAVNITIKAIIPTDAEKRQELFKSLEDNGVIPPFEGNVRATNLDIWMESRLTEYRKVLTANGFMQVPTSPHEDEVYIRI